MAAFAQYYVVFLWNFVQNVGEFFKNFGLTFYKFFGTDIVKYFDDIGIAIAGADWDVLSWIMLIVSLLINLTLVFFVVYRLVQLIRRYIIFRSKEVDKDKLMEEIARLKLQAEELADEKKKIFSLKIGGRLASEIADSALSPVQAVDGSAVMSAAPTTASATGASVVAASAVVGASKVDTGSRFSKLTFIDEKYERNPSYIFMDEAEMYPLPQIVKNFVNFAASQLKLFYTEKIIRQFFSGLATSKILILEGISGTGKTSLPYAMGKFFTNNASIISVQPSWRDRSELIGYFNEFTKKFNETDFLASLYETTLREDPSFIVLDEMNIARIEYYFADFLSIMEMPDVAEWKIDLVSEVMPSDPKNIIYGKLLVPQNVWFIGTANNDDSTFTITDKVYDRAIALTMNAKAQYFDAPMTEAYKCSYSYLESLFEKAKNDNKISEKTMGLLAELDDFIQKNFKIAIGNRIMKQIKLFVPVYIAAGGTELEALDFLITSKILRKFTSLNLPFLTKELADLVSFMDKKFGKKVMCDSIAYIKELQKNN